MFSTLGYRGRHLLIIYTLISPVEPLVRSYLKAKRKHSVIFWYLFPATAGILAGASMLGELKTPSKSIPQGTLRGLLVTFILYVSVIVSMGAAIPRELLYVDIKVIQTVNLSDIIIILVNFQLHYFQ